MDIDRDKIPGISCGEGVNTSPFKALRYSDTGTFVRIDPDLAHGPMRFLRRSSS